MGFSDDLIPLVEAYKLPIQAMQIPGHELPISPNMNLKKLTKDLKELTHQSWRKQILVGYSMGGRIAIELYPLIKDQVAGMVLIGAHPGFQDSEEQVLRLSIDQKIATKLMKEDFAEFLDEWYNALLFKGIKEAPAYSQLIRKKLEHDPLKLAQALLAFSSSQQKYHEDLWKNLEVPVLYISGTEDSKYHKVGDQLQEVSSYVKHHSIGTCSHAPHVQNLSLVQASIASWLSANFDLLPS